jgi:hypothetical protein
MLETSLNTGTILKGDNGIFACKKAQMVKQKIYREEGEGYIDESGFKQIIKNDTESTNSLFLVAEV